MPKKSYQVESLERECASLRAQLKRMLQDPGDVPFVACDNSCACATPSGGMMTNGGCRCDERKLRMATRYWRRRAQHLQAVIQDMRDGYGCCSACDCVLVNSDEPWREDRLCRRCRDMGDVCSTCGEAYSKIPSTRASFCSSGFHACRDCLWDEGVAVKVCDFHKASADVPFGLSDGKMREAERLASERKEG